MVDLEMYSLVKTLLSDAHRIENVFRGFAQIDDDRTLKNAIINLQTEATTPMRMIKFFRTWLDQMEKQA